MAEKNSVKVVIAGKTITLGGYESVEYLERVAFYVNNKIAELSDTPGYRRQTEDMKNTLLVLNVADDYFKAKTRADSLENDIETKDEDSYSVKQDLAAAQVRIQELSREIAALRNQNQRAGHAAPQAADPENRAGQSVAHGTEQTSRQESDSASKRALLNQKRSQRYSRAVQSGSANE